MKITSIETYPVWGGHRNFLFVAVDTDEGVYGVGEAGITGRELAVHNPLGPGSSAACLHLNLACPNFGVQEQPRRTGTVLTDIVPVQPAWKDGYRLGRGGRTIPPLKRCGGRKGFENAPRAVQVR